MEAADWERSNSGRLLMDPMAPWLSSRRIGLGFFMTVSETIGELSTTSVLGFSTQVTFSSSVSANTSSVFSVCSLQAAELLPFFQHLLQIWLHALRFDQNATDSTTKL